LLFDNDLTIVSSLVLFQRFLRLRNQQNRALSPSDLSGPCSIFRNHLFKANQAFPFQAHFVFFSDPSNRAYPLVRSFIAFFRLVLCS
jgi:hypothetical protein